MSTFSRRQALGLLGAGLLAGGGRSRAAGGGERKLLVILNQGGWDTTRVFNPAFGEPLVDMEEDAAPFSAGPFTLVDHGDRPSVKSWFEAHHSRVALVHGMEVRSISHERCLRLLMTGQGASGADDWPSRIAAASAQPRPLPYLVLSGPAYTTTTTPQVVRVGDDGQLPDLLSGAALSGTDPGIRLPSSSTVALQRALLRERIGARAAGAVGQDRAWLERHAAVLDAVESLEARQVDLSGGPVGSLCGGVEGQLLTALDALEADLSRAALVQYHGRCGPDWDQHSDIGHQSGSFEDLFQQLHLLMDELQARPGSGGGSLLDELTVLVCSEMGRHPMLNSLGGKDHWTYTSFMLFGAGVRGGVEVGGYDENSFGRTVDLATGGEGDRSVLPENLGATLMALAGEAPDTDPIEAVLA